MTAGPTSATTTGSRIVRTIDLEHHFVTPLYMETLRTNQTAPRIGEG
jgi:hypothetical protein